MSMRLLRILSLTFTVLYVGPAFGQSPDFDQPQEIFEKARSLDSRGDPGAEDEYRRAIAARNGVYPEAWRRLSVFFAERLRFAEAEQAISAYQKFLKLRPKRFAHLDGAVRKSIADLRMVIKNPALVERKPIK